MARILAACLARNEAGRYLRSALESWCRIADSVILLDDNSTDDTPRLARAFPRVTYISRSETDAAWGRESSARAQLFLSALERAEAGDWLLIADADQTWASDPRPLLEDGIADEWRFQLYDLWGEWNGRLLYREDKYWQAHRNWRAWAVRVPAHPPEGWRWSERGIHCGHLPTNWYSSTVGYAPREYAILHYGYFDAMDRQEKHARYLAVADQLSDAERAHADSITWPRVNLRMLPFNPQYTLQREAYGFASAA